MTTDKRLIEESFPVKEVSAESSREKNIRHGNISTLHIWWARRPLAASRATAYAALVPPPKDDEEWQKQRNFIIELSKWENSNNSALLEKARADILKANSGVPPKVLDPFGGGGSIPLEALRLGCETYSNDYNPVAVLIQKCTLEYPQKYGHRPKKNEKWGELSGSEDNPLLADMKKWGQWILEQAKKKIGKYYPHDPDGSIPVGYLWARTIPCQNPSCGAEIPLMRQFWLAKKDKTKIMLFQYVERGKIQFKIIGDGYEKIPEDFDPDLGTVARAVVTCPCCGSTMEPKTLQKLFHEGKSGEMMTAVVLHKPGTVGKKYRLATEEDMVIFRQASADLEREKPVLREQWGMEPVPDELLPPKNSHRSVGSQLPIYGFKTWGELFNTRQKLALVTFTDLVRKSYKKMVFEGYNEEYAKVVTTYLSFGIDRLVDYGSKLCTWNYTGGRGVGHSMQRQSLPMVWDYPESNPFNVAAAGWPTSCEKNEKWIQYSSRINNQTCQISQLSATSLLYVSSSFDAVFTDPPYYDNVPYSYLSDFFYVWLKRSVGDFHPELFSTQLTPKKQEIVVYDNVDGGKEGAKQSFEDNLKKSFQEIQRVLKPNGITIIVYAHKSTEGWETLINSLLDSGLIITSAWPINTEMGSRMNA
ncbi:MAG: DUF1156 domain-containing protein, partial [Deltaproteobacteria bacterium]